MYQKNLLFDKSNLLVKQIYKSTLSFPYIFRDSIGDQLRRSSLSIVLNIVEGGARKYTKEKKQFLNIAYSSLKETKYLIYFSHEFKLISDVFYNDIMAKINELARILYSLIYRK